MARPFEKPLKMEGNYTYTKLGNKLIAFASEVVQNDELEVISAINHAYDRNTAMFITAEQHKRVMRIISNYNVLVL